MSELSDARHELAAGLTAAVGITVYPAPPPSIVPPCAIVIPTVGYITGPMTGCAYGAVVTVRYVTDVHEQQGAYDALDAFLEAGLSVVVGYSSVSVAAHDYGGSRYLCADATVAYAVDLRRRPAVASLKG
jgi:hypothetical protein